MTKIPIYNGKINNSNILFQTERTLYAQSVLNVPKVWLNRENALRAKCFKCAESLVKQRERFTRKVF